MKVKTLKVFMTILSFMFVTSLFVLGGNLINTLSPHTNSLYGIMFGLIYIGWFFAIKDGIWGKF